MEYWAEYGLFPCYRDVSCLCLLQRICCYRIICYVYTFLFVKNIFSFTLFSSYTFMFFTTVFNLSENSNFFYCFKRTLYHLKQLKSLQSRVYFSKKTIRSVIVIFLQKKLTNRKEC